MLRRVLCIASGDGRSVGRSVGWPTLFAKVAFLAAGQNAEVVYFVPLSPSFPRAVRIPETNNGNGANYTTDKRVVLSVLRVSNPAILQIK